MSSAEADWANDRRYWLDKLKKGDKVFVYFDTNNGNSKREVAIVEDVTVIKEGYPRAGYDDYLRVTRVFVEVVGYDHCGHELIIDALHNSMIMEYFEEKP
jgi:hypothetical protein